jgi:putative addiction module component (TIGR02574 family)
MKVSVYMQKFGIDQLNVQQRLALIEEIWESIDAEDAHAAQLSEAQRAELESRLFETDFYPEDGFELDDVEDLLLFPDAERSGRH